MSTGPNDLRRLGACRLGNTACGLLTDSDSPAVSGAARIETKVSSIPSSDQERTLRICFHVFEETP